MLRFESLKLVMGTRRERKGCKRRKIPATETKVELSLDRLTQKKLTETLLSTLLPHDTNI